MPRKKLTKDEWAQIWDRFDNVVNKATYDRLFCKKCHAYGPSKYDDWEEQQKLIEKIVNEKLKERHA